ncbi:hypothetical protein [Micromonospora violae]|uniref:hypothetical protein n=1 Tax=Micromonospora violae TaxID=1278207 RepID=UPI001ABF305E|nr:hypothetical protein [Micromonospora violae]
MTRLLRLLRWSLDGLRRDSKTALLVEDERMRKSFGQLGQPGYGQDDSAGSQKRGNLLERQWTSLQQQIIRRCEIRRHHR